MPYSCISSYLSSVVVDPCYSGVCRQAPAAARPRASQDPPSPAARVRAPPQNFAGIRHNRQQQGQRLPRHGRRRRQEGRAHPWDGTPPWRWSSFSTPRRGPMEPPSFSGDFFSAPPPPPLLYFEQYHALFQIHVPMDDIWQVRWLLQSEVNPFIGCCLGLIRLSFSKEICYIF